MLGSASFSLKVTSLSTKWDIMTEMALWGQRINQQLVCRTLPRQMLSIISI